jgi:C_GCAxxG_C_C family probable redox protein
VLAVGEHLWGRVDDRIRRMTTGLGGGVGGTERELCGALSGGVLLIGALHGRTRPHEDDSVCQMLASRYRERFAQEFGTTNCGEIREDGYGSGGTVPCSALVERAAHILLEVLANDE